MEAHNPYRPPETERQVTLPLSGWSLVAAGAGVIAIVLWVYLMAMMFHPRAISTADLYVPRTAQPGGFAADYLATYLVLTVVCLVCIGAGVIGLHDVKQWPGKRGAFLAWFGLVVGISACLVMYVLAYAPS